MTDISSAGVEADQDTSTEASELLANMGDFFNSSLQMDDGQDDPADNDSQSGDEGAESESGSAQNDSISAAGNGEPTPSGEGADVVQPDPEISQADLAAMMGFTDPKAVAPAAAPDSKPAEPNEADEDEPFAPFQPNFKLPQNIVQGIFEAEDTETREQSLVNLLSAFGNSITMSMDKRMQQMMKDKYAPQFYEEFSQRTAAKTAGDAIHTDFYGNFPELKDYGPMVKKALEIVVAADPGAPYTEATRNKVGKLVRETLARQGIKVVPTKAAAADPSPGKKTPAPARRTPPPGFEAGAGRPASSSPGSDPGPADLVDQLSAWA